MTVAFVGASLWHLPRATEENYERPSRHTLVRMAAIYTRSEIGSSRIRGVDTDLRCAVSVSI
jgi:hypothetical protein